MRKILFFSLSILIFSLFFLMINSDKESGMNMQLKGESFIEGLKIYHKINGKPLWVLSAKRADILEDGDRARLSGIQMNIEDRNMTIVAEKGDYELSSKQILIEGQVTATNPTYSLTTENVEIDTAAGTLKTNGAVKIEGRKFNLQGRGMNIDNAEQKVRITDGVKATFHN